jgi:hypothetical protein
MNQPRKAGSWKIQIMEKFQNRSRSTSLSTLLYRSEFQLFPSGRAFVIECFCGLSPHYRRVRDNNEADGAHGMMTTLWSVLCLQNCNWLIFFFETRLIIDLPEIISANIQVSFMNNLNLNSELIDNNCY